MLGDLRHFGDLLRRNADLFPEELGLADDEHRLSWSELYARCRRMASSLRALGLEPGERVGILSSNRVAFVEALFALAGSGLVAVPVNTRLTVEDLGQLLGDCSARALLVDTEFGETGSELAQRLTPPSGAPLILGALSSNCGSGITPHEELLSERPGWEEAFDGARKPEDLLLLLYTSGTTGLPKGVMYSHESALWTTLIHVLAIGSARRHRVLLPSPLYSAAGFAGISCAVAVGSPTHLLQFTIERFLETVERERITFTNLVPTTLRMVLDHASCADYNLDSLELLLYGGSPMPAATLRAAADRLRCGFRQTFATSETGLSGTVLEPSDHDEALNDPEAAHRLLSCGRPQIGVGVRLIDGEWNTVPHGSEGEIAVCCAGNMVGYWNRPEATVETIRDGWIRTGDIARRDDEGYFYLLDRKHDMIVSGALNVFPSEVERAITEHPDVEACAVIGVPDERWGEAVTALVVRAPESQVTADEILAFARERLAGFKRPKRVEIISEIPVNPAGKPLRRLLREPYWPQDDRRVG